MCGFLPWRGEYQGETEHLATSREFANSYVDKVLVSLDQTGVVGWALKVTGSWFEAVRVCEGRMRARTERH